MGNILTNLSNEKISSKEEWTTESVHITCNYEHDKKTITIINLKTSKGLKIVVSAQQSIEEIINFFI